MSVQSSYKACHQAAPQGPEDRDQDIQQENLEHY